MKAHNACKRHVTTRGKPNASRLSHDPNEETLKYLITHKALSPRRLPADEGEAGEVSKSPRRQ